MESNDSARGFVPRTLAELDQCMPLGEHDRPLSDAACYRLWPHAPRRTGCAPPSAAPPGAVTERHRRIGAAFRRSRESAP